MTELKVFYLLTAMDSETERRSNVALQCEVVQLFKHPVEHGNCDVGTSVCDVR